MGKMIVFGLIVMFLLGAIMDNGVDGENKITELAYYPEDKTLYVNLKPHMIEYRYSNGVEYNFEDAVPEKYYR